MTNESSSESANEATRDTHIKEQLRQWIASQHPGLSPAAISDDTPLITGRLITSLQVLDLLLYVESLGAPALAPSQLRPAAFHSVASIYRTFFQGAAHA